MTTFPGGTTKNRGSWSLAADPIRGRKKNPFPCVFFKKQNIQFVCLMYYGRHRIRSSWAISFLSACLRCVSNQQGQIGAVCVRLISWCVGRRSPMHWFGLGRTRLPLNPNPTLLLATRTPQSFWFSKNLRFSLQPSLGSPGDSGGSESNHFCS